MNGNKDPYITIGFGWGGYYAVKRVWYEEDKMWDNCQTGTTGKRPAAVAEAQAWAKAEGIECRV